MRFSRLALLSRRLTRCGAQNDPNGALPIGLKGRANAE